MYNILKVLKLKRIGIWLIFMYYLIIIISSGKIYKYKCVLKYQIYKDLNK